MERNVTLDMRIDLAVNKLRTALSILEPDPTNAQELMARSLLLDCERILDTVVNDPRIAILDVGDADDDQLELLLGFPMTEGDYEEYDEPRRY